MWLKDSRPSVSPLLGGINEASYSTFVLFDFGKIKESKKVKMWARDMTEPLRVLAVPVVDLNLGPQIHVRRFATT